MAVQYNNNLADWARKITGELSLRQVEIKTGVTYSTVKNILDGRVPEATILIRFAGAFGEDITKVLRLAGYDDIALLWENGKSQSEGSAPGSGEYHPDDIPPELLNVYGLHGQVYNHLPFGRAREKYIEKLRATAESDWELLVAREEASKQE